MNWNKTHLKTIAERESLLTKLTKSEIKCSLFLEVDMATIKKNQFNKKNK